MNWKQVETVATNGSLSVKDWKSLSDGLWENKDNDCPKYKIYHKNNSRTLRFEFGIINDKKAEKVKSYLEHNYSIPEIKPRANTIVSINGVKFRIGLGSDLRYIVFKPINRQIQYLNEFDEKKLIQEFENFRNSVINSGLDKLLAQIN